MTFSCGRIVFRYQLPPMALCWSRASQMAVGCARELMALLLTEIQPSYHRIDKCLRVCVCEHATLSVPDYGYAAPNRASFVTNEYIRNASVIRGEDDVAWHIELEHTSVSSESEMGIGQLKYLFNSIKLKPFHIFTVRLLKSRWAKLNRLWAVASLEKCNQFLSFQFSSDLRIRTLSVPSTQMIKKTLLDCGPLLAQWPNADGR